MSFIRPEAQAALWRWREVLLGSVLTALFLLWALSSFGIVRMIAFVLMALAIVLILAGIQRGRFRGKGGGQGVVQLIEGQVTYYGPLSGGAVALSELAALSLDGRSSPAHWLLVPDQGNALQIPIGAEGADALFDAFAGLQGLRIEHLLRIKQAEHPGLQVVWRRADVQSRINQLH
ncbi:hypothetical protein [Planktotalea sp.]|uniref:hypothetical protein n=1 Tax=Planktotalea sp. TaxID=2029877 RepID=UPI003296DB7A